MKKKQSRRSRRRRRKSSNVLSFSIYVRVPPVLNSPAPIYVQVEKKKRKERPSIKLFLLLFYIRTYGENICKPVDVYIYMYKDTFCSAAAHSAKIHLMQLSFQCERLHYVLHTTILMPSRWCNKSSSMSAASSFEVYIFNILREGERESRYWNVFSLCSNTLLRTRYASKAQNA